MTLRVVPNVGAMCLLVCCWTQILSTASFTAWASGRVSPLECRTSRPTAVDRAYSKNSNRLTMQQEILACDFADFFDSWGTLSNFAGDGVLSSGISTTLSGVIGNSNGSGLDPAKGLCPETGKFWLGPAPWCGFTSHLCTIVKRTRLLCHG